MLRTIETTWQDARYALRGLRRNPGFTLTAILAAALGIGATSAVFSAVDGVLFRALPFAQENQLVSVGMMAPLDSNEFLLAEPYFDLRRNPGPFQQVTAFEAGNFAVDLTESNPVRLRGLRVEANFLSALGFRPVLGRTFTAEEDRPGGPKVALISMALWKSRYAGDPGAVGRMLSLDGTPVEIIGVLPKEFETPTLAAADVLFPLALNEATERSGRALRAFARMKPGVSVQRAVAELQPQFQRALDTVPPQFRKEVSLRVRPVRDRQVGDVRAASLALFGSVLAVLLIACANIASLLLARSVKREREFVVRMALGASRVRMMRQALTESLILSAIGGAAGCFVAWGLLRSFVAIAPAGLPRLNEAAIDGRVLLFTLAAAIVAGLVFGLVPNLRHPGSLGMGGQRSTVRSRGGLRSSLVTLEIAFSMVLLTGAGLLLHSLWKLESLPLGMQSEHVLTARFVLGRQHYGEQAQQLSFFTRLEEKIATMPGFEQMAITDSIPPSGGMRGRPFATIEVEGRPPQPEGTGGMVAWRYVTPGYFGALGIPILRGRGFTEQDREPSSFVTVLSESLARRMFPQQDPIGKRILKGPEGQWTTVVGVAGDVPNLRAARDSWPEFYILRKHAADYHFQNQEPPTGWRSAIVMVRTAANPDLAATSLRGLLGSLDSTLPVEIQTMRGRLEEIDQRPRFYAILLTTFAAIGLLIAAIGLFGVMSFLVTQRTREIGVRIALGATPGRILRMTLAWTGRWTVAGIVIGGVGSFAAARLIRSLLFQVEPGDPAAVIVAVLVLGAAALLAAVVPARRAARLDPARTLQED